MGWTSLLVLHVVLTALPRCCISSSLPASDTSSYAHVLLIQQQGPEVRIQQMNLFNGECQDTHHLERESLSESDAARALVYRPGEASEHTVCVRLCMCACVAVCVCLCMYVCLFGRIRVSCVCVV